MKGIYGVVDFTTCGDIKEVLAVLGNRSGVGRPRSVSDHILGLRLGGNDGVVLSDKQFLLFVGIGMRCVYRNMVLYHRGEVMGLAGIGRSSYWACLKALGEYGLIVNSGLTFKDSKVSMSFVSPDYFYSGSEGWRSYDLTRWGLGKKTFGIEEK